MSNYKMAKPKTRRLSKARSEEIRKAKSLNRKDDEARAALSKPGVMAFFDSLPKQKKSTKKKK
jgi:hypothetical protein